MYSDGNIHALVEVFFNYVCIYIYIKKAVVALSILSVLSRLYGERELFTQQEVATSPLSPLYPAR